MGKRPEAASVPQEDVPAAETASHDKPRSKTPRAPRIPEHLPLTEETLDPPEVLAEPEAWRRIGEEIREQLDYRRGHFRRIRLIRGKYVRKDDPSAVPRIAPIPANLQDRCTATPGLIAEGRHQPLPPPPALPPAGRHIYPPGSPASPQNPLRPGPARFRLVSRHP